MTATGLLVVYSFVEKEYADPKTTPLKIKIKKGKNIETYECGKPVRQLLRKVKP